MIVVSNSYVPKLNKRKGLKDQTIIADTPAGDLAYYVTPTAKKRSRFYEDDSDDESDEDDDFGDKAFGEDDFGFAYDKPVVSITGSQWRPKFNDRMTIFIAGAPGAGKSYLAKELIKLLPESIKILLFTALEERDGNFDELGKDRLFKIKMTPENLSNITLKEIRERALSSAAKQVILLFDDVDKIRDKKVQDLTFGIMNDALANGRGHEKHDGDGDIHVICTSHSLNDFIKTKYMFDNSNYIAMFPGSTPPKQLYLMFEKLGLEKDLCQKMIRLGRLGKVRSIIVHKVVPMYLIFGNRIMLI